MTPVSHGKPCAGNPHARFEEGASAQAEPRRSALLHKAKALFRTTMTYSGDILGWKGSLPLYSHIAKGY